MGPQEEKIRIADREDLGPVLARADHDLNVIEVNKAAFYKLPPMMQEFVLCHEVCHLKHHEWDEAETNRLASRLFMDRAANDADRQERERFLSYLDGTDTSNFDVASILALASGIWNLGTGIWGTIRQRNAGWYSWDAATQRANLNVMLKQAFEQGRRSASQSAGDFLWEQLRSYTNKDSSLEEFLARTDNAWVKTVIAKYETAYGHGLEEVTAIDITAFPLVMIALGALAGFVIYKIIKNAKK